MSVHQESLDTMANSVERASDAEERRDEDDAGEYTELRADTLAMFGAAIGGAILGMLLTLLVLALINGGSLVYGNSEEEMAAVEANLQRINENVGAVSTNVDIVAEQVGANQAELAAFESVVSEEFATQSEAIATNQAAIGVLNDTRIQFDIFVDAMAGALVSMEEAVSDEDVVSSAEAEAVEPAAPMAAEALPVPMVANSADVPAGDIAVVLFADANGDGVMNEGETNLVGATVVLIDATGESVAQVVSEESGALFEELESAEYEVVVEDALGYELYSQPTASVGITDDDAEGYIVYIPASTTAE